MKTCIVQYNLMFFFFFFFFLQNWERVISDDWSVYGLSPLTKYHIPDAAAFNLLGKEEEVSNIHDSYTGVHYLLLLGQT